MLDSYPRPPPRTDASGFTLLEVLVVLFILGLISAVAIPQLPVIAERVDFAMQRESFEKALNGLAYEAYRTNQNLVLGDPTKQGNAALSSLRANASSLYTAYGIPMVHETANLELPPGWRLDVDAPVIYHTSGYCSGGKALLTTGELEYTYVLAAPLCRATLVP